MTTTRHLLASGDFTQDWSNTGLIAVDDDWSGVASITGYRGDDLTTIVGANPGTLTANTASPVDVIANQTNTSLTTGGVAEFQITNPTIALQGSGTSDAPNIVIYLDATGRQGIAFSVNLRDLDASADNAAQPIAIQYRTSAAGVWIDLPAAYTADASSGPSLATLVTPVSVTLPTDANNMAELEIRIITANATGSDEWIGLDDIVVSSTAISSPIGQLSVNNVSLAEGDTGSTFMTFTVTRSGSTTGTASVDYTVVNNTTANDDFASALPSGTLSFADGEASKTVNIAIAGDTIVEPNETFFLNLSNAVNATLNDGQGIGTISNDDFSAVAINQIQGATHSSAFAGQTLSTTGIVTGVDTDGFYIQSATPDSDDATSEGLFIFTSTAPTVAVGDAVTVTGTVQEFVPGANTANLTTTRMISPSVVVQSSGNALPDAVFIGAGGRLPPTDVFEDDGFTSFDILTDAADYFESLEGMRVTIDQPQVTSPTNSFGETWVVAEEGAGSTGQNERNGMTISGNASGPDDYNPERIQIDDDTGLFAGFTPGYTQGDLLSNVTGIVSYNFQSYEVLVTQAVLLNNDGPTPEQEVTSITGSATQLTIATYNVENLDPTDTKFALLGEDIALNLGAPDVIGLNEIQDADGAGSGSNLSGQDTANLLIAAIQAAGGPAYQYVEVAPATANTTGGEPFGNIRNGFLYNPLRVDYVANSATLITGSAFAASRNPLAAQFEFNNQIVTAISVHSTSRGGSTALFGSTQPQVIGGEASRNAQAAAIRGYVDGLLAADPNAYVAVLGDFNGFAFETAIETITAGGVMVDASSLLPEAERYSYVFEGNSQLLDHILLTANLIPRAAYDAVHLNAEQVASATRPTDHDPQIVSVTILPVATGWTTGNDENPNAATSDTINGLAGIDRLNMSAATQSITVSLQDGTIAGLDVGNDVVSNIEVFDLGEGVDTFIGNNAGSTVRGNGGADLLSGGTGRDLFSGGAGDDTLLGGAGTANELGGGDGNDTYTVSAVGDSVLEAAFGGIDTVNTTLGVYVMAANVENLNATGAGPFVGIGNGDDNTINGSAGVDFLSGMGGNDQIATMAGGPSTLLGGAGDDSFYISNAGDSVIEFASEGSDRVVSGATSYRLGANIETLEFQSGAASVGYGNSQDNTIRGTLFGDTLFGGDGNDWIEGGEFDANTLIGGAGDDTYIVAAAGDSVLEEAGGGTDTVETSLGVYVMAANVENLTYRGTGDFLGIGNALDNTIVGGFGADFLAGGDGADTLTGSVGADMFRFTEAGDGDVITDFAAGTDRILFSVFDFATTETVEFVTGSGGVVPTNGNATLLYDTSTGLLRLDPDGNGAMAAFDVVTLTGAPTLAMTDILFI